MSLYHERSTNIALPRAFYKNSLYHERSTNVALPRAFYKCRSTMSILQILLSVKLHFVLQLHIDYSSSSSSHYHQISKDQISESLKTTSFLQPLTVTVPNPLQVFEITVKA
ncbi:hypothetical protein LWI29_030882 [Acer saccharum]|uniref:Uncharacterized protein n=1 Tax=Acer saccharum TaxID=4024 RepID=A0AA39VVY1_ACESA|nr:hypothetical protein LWI29_030882 [Acer saccharum]